MTRCKYTVTYGPHIARFSNEQDARIFGRHMSGTGTLIEMRDKTGLIGQWQNGKATEEFKHADA